MALTAAASPADARGKLKAEGADVSGDSLAPFEQQRPFFFCASKLASGPVARGGGGRLVGAGSNVNALPSARWP